MSGVEATINSVRTYLTSVRLDGNGLIEPSDSVKNVFKLYRGFLIVRLVIEQSNLPDKTKLFFDEAISDISSATFLTISGMYKPARLLLRGAIESVIRFAVEVHGKDSDELDSVTQLFTTAKQIYADHEVVRSAIGSLTGIYSDLCKTTHVTDPHLMELRVPFVELFHFDRIKFDKNMNSLRLLLSTLLPLLFCLSNEWLSRIDHANADALRKLIPADKKRQFRDYLTSR